MSAALAPLRVYRTDAETRFIAKLRRAQRREMGVCINGDKHGPATSGVLCARCREQHRRSA